MKKGLTILALSAIMLMSVSMAALADPLTKVSNNQSMVGQVSDPKTVSPSLSEKLQTTQNVNPASINGNAQPAVKPSRWSRFKSYFHDRVVQPVKSGWAHLKSHWHKNKASAVTQPSPAEARS